MKKREFKSSSKKILDMMINSIYTNKEIFLRELLSNASDALDKFYYLSLTDSDIKLKKEDLEINIACDKENRIITISDNGIGMNEEELENNLGVIAESGSLKFKEDNKNQKDTEIIGQFGVGFYSAFMVAKKIDVCTKKYNEETGYLWSSEGADGYTISKYDKESNGTDIRLYLKDDIDDENYSDYLSEYKIRNLVSKYSDYLRYPIKMEVENSKLKEGSTDEYEKVLEVETLNSMIPLWKKDKKDISEDEYNNFYTSKFMDYENPLRVIQASVEGSVSYKTLMFIPSHAPFDYYYKDYKKGLELYTNGVLIMEKCEELLPDYYSFVKGVVDSSDLSLNISREMLQNDRHLLTIAKTLETKIHNELLDMLNNDFESYKKFFEAFGSQIKYGVYNMYGLNKDKLKDLLVFYSSKKGDLITLEEYVNNMEENQENIYYACGETVDKINMLPQVEQVKNKNYDILYLTDYLDEFVIQVLQNYNDKSFKNVSDASLDLDTEEEKEAIKKLNDDNKKMLEFIKEALDDCVVDVRFTNKLSNHPVCLTSDGEISVEMQKVINAMPTDENVKAKMILEINEKHPIADKLKSLYKDNKDELKKYAKVLYSSSRLIEGLSIDNPTEISNIICDLIANK
jgi:molecular chaperone HtpG